MPAIGDTLHIRVQIEENDRYIRAIIKNALGATITTVQLPVFGDGLYGEDSYIMPPLEIITATVEVYLDSLFTERDEKYASDLLEYRLELGPSDNIQNIFGGEIVGSIDSDESVSATISDNPIFGVTQETDGLHGVIGEITVTGEIEGEN